MATAKFSKQHYVVIATTLKEANADWGIMEAFVRMLEEDNYRFDSDRFRWAIGGGADRDYPSM